MADIKWSVSFNAAMTCRVRNWNIRGTGQAFCKLLQQAVEWNLIKAGSSGISNTLLWMYNSIEFQWFCVCLLFETWSLSACVALLFPTPLSFIQTKLNDSTLLRCCSMVLGISRRFAGPPYLLLHECSTLLRNVQNYLSKDSITFQEACTFISNALRTLNFSSETWLSEVTWLKVLNSDNYVPYFFFRF